MISKVIGLYALKSGDIKPGWLKIALAQAKEDLAFLDTLRQTRKEQHHVVDRPSTNS